MTEKELFNHGNVIITQSRATFGASMYPILSLTKVKTSKTAYYVPSSKSYILKILSIVFFIVFFTIKPDLLGVNVLCTGLIFALSYFFIQVLYTYHIEFYTSGTNIQAYSSNDKEEIIDIVKAINEAIIARS